MDLDTLLASLRFVTTPAALLANAPGSTEMLRVVLFLAAIVGCGSVVVAWVSRDNR